jgi:AbrB family looped-hinge helix DNA binding protein
MTLIDIKTTKVTRKGQIAIPRDLRGKEFKEGSKVAILTYEDRMEIRPISYVCEKIGTAIASEKSLAKEWDNPEEDKAWKDL